MTQNCYRCGEFLAEPVERNANYVRGDDTVETVEQEVLVERRHTDYSRAIRERLQEEHGLNAAQANRVMARNDETYLRRGMAHDVTDEAFERVETNDPSAPEVDPEVVRVDSETVEREQQRTGLVCPDCVRDADEVIW
jgi:hypothetical protein